MLHEIWKPVVGYEGLYEVSNLGRVKSHYGKNITGARILRQLPNANGYLRCRLYKAKRVKDRAVHSLVLEAFVCKRPTDEHQGAHKNGNRSDNTLENLYWATPLENMRDRDAHGNTAAGTRNGYAKLTDDAVRFIRENYNWQKTSRSNSRMLAEKFGVSMHAICEVVRKKTWENVPDARQALAELKGEK